MGFFELIWKYRQAFVVGLSITLKICLIVWLAGLVLGFALGFLAYKKRWMSFPLNWTSNLVAALPVIVFLFWMHYPLQAMLGVVIDPFITSVITFSIVNVLGVANIFRTAMAEMPTQYLTAAKTLGIPHKTTVRRIQLPLIFRSVTPPLITLQINILQISLFSSFIGVEDIFRMAQRINAIAYKPVEIYTALGLFFVIICLPINILARYLNRKYTRDISEK